MLLFGFAALMLMHILCGRAQAAEPPRYSSYEKETLEEALKRNKVALDPKPEGKIVESISIDVLDVIEQRDPAPGFLNWFHVNSRDDVIRRELLFAPGQPYEQGSISESERNLRSLRQHS